MISEEVYSEFVANIDELLKSPSTMDWILAAELREGLEQLNRQGRREDGGHPGRGDWPPGQGGWPPGQDHGPVGSHDEPVSSHDQLPAEDDGPAASG